MRRILLLIACLLVLVGCGPTGSVPLPGTTTVPTIPPTTASNTAELQADLNDGQLHIDRTIVSDGTLRPPAGATITFGPNGRLTRTPASTGAAVDVATAGVTITNLRVTGPNPCYWTNTQAFNPASIGEQYAQYNSSREEQAALYVRTGATRLTVNGLDARDVWGDGITILGGTDLTFRDVNVRCPGRSGISNVDSARVTVTGGSISGAFWWALNIEPFSTRSVVDYTVSGVTIGYSRDKWLYVNGPDFNCAVRGVNVAGVTLLATATRPANVAGCAAGAMLGAR